MNVVILAGGLGTRISEESYLKPKPMIEIGGKPILWHIMKLYSAHGAHDFVICCGYKGYVIKEYFANYFLHMSDVTFDMADNSVIVHQQKAERWRVTTIASPSGPRAAITTSGTRTPAWAAMTVASASCSTCSSRPAGALRCGSLYESWRHSRARR